MPFRLFALLLLPLAWSGCHSLATTDTAPENAGAARQFLVAHMPAADQGAVAETAIAENVNAALEARRRFSWAREVPWELFLNDVLPYATVTERRDPWRRLFLEKFTPVVAKCHGAREAVLAINARIAAELKVKYSTARRRPDQGPLESMESGIASCTGLSILLIDACRAVGIPARLAGIVSWSHIEGNHNWVEVWFEGDWHMTEYGADGFDTEWVIENCGLLDTSRWEHKVWASSWKPQGNDFFPMVWTFEARDKGLAIGPQGLSVPGLDASPRYAELARRLHDRRAAARPRKLFVDCKTAEGTRLPCPVRVYDGSSLVASGVTKAGTADSRDLLRLDLPDKPAFTLEYEPTPGHPVRQPLQFVNGDPLVLVLDAKPSAGPARWETTDGHGRGSGVRRVRSWRLNPASGARGHPKKASGNHGRTRTRVRGQASQVLAP